MRFLDAIFWILLLYCIYYVIIILYDNFVKRTVNDVTGVQEITVLKPDYKPTHVRTTTIPPPPPNQIRDYFVDDTDESGRQSSVGEKKK
jgi:hypothetical protein